MLDDDLIYYRRRVAAEHHQALHATCPQATLIHTTLEHAYQARLATLESNQRVEHA